MNRRKVRGQVVLYISSAGGYTLGVQAAGTKYTEKTGLSPAARQSYTLLATRRYIHNLARLAGSYNIRANYSISGHHVVHCHLTRWPPPGKLLLTRVQTHTHISALTRRRARGPCVFPSLSRSRDCYNCPERRDALRLPLSRALE